jgi:geranylgeranylglycerol-phosphate geranylgeranyltransferase
MKTAFAILKIIRPVNFLITFVAVYIGGIIAWNELVINKEIFLAALSAALIAAGGNIINDVFDVKIDRISHPKRPLPSGKMSINQAVFFYLIFSAVGIFLSEEINVITFMVAIFAFVLLFFYSCCIKKIPLLGNFIIGVMTGLAFIYGGVAVHKISYTLFPALFALLANFAREILKDIEDIEGDEAVGVATYPILFGIDSAVIMAKITVAFLFVATLIAYFLNFYSKTYLFLILFVDLALAYFLFALSEEPSKHELKKMSALLKAVMVVGLIAVWIGVK